MRSGRASNGALLIAVVVFLWVILPAYAQSTPEPVSDDAVNSVARQMYCPVCENIPLDVCGTEACAQWREEIRVQLGEGRTSSQVIDDFVARYGDRVVGTPQDAGLRDLSLSTPLRIGAVVIGIALWVLIRWRRTKQVIPDPAMQRATTDLSDDDYRARIEADLRARR